MDYYFKKKIEAAENLVNTAIIHIEKRVEDMTECINNQMDKIYERKSTLVDEKNKLYRNIETLKLDIVKLESKRERVQDE